jgi:PDZ domain
MLGIEYEPEMASKRLRITAVHGGGPAAAAGLQTNDTLLEVNGTPAVTGESLQEALRKHAPGEGIELVVQRAGTAVPVRVTAILARRPAGSLAERIALELIDTFPLLFLVVGLAVLFQRLADPHAWRLALMFAGFIASAPIELEHVHPLLRPFATAYVAVFLNLSSALFYAFFALFPTPSLVHARWPWLLKAGLGIGAGSPA